MWNLATDFGAVGSVLPCCQSMLSRSSSVISHILLAEALLLLDFSSSDLFILLLLTSSTAMTSTSSSTSSFTETETFQVRLGSCLHAWLEDALPTGVGYLRARQEVGFPDLTWDQWNLRLNLLYWTSLLAALTSDVHFYLIWLTCTWKWI